MIATILNALKAIFAAVLEMAGDVIGFITTASTAETGGNELVLLFLLIPLVGIGVGMLTRLIRARG